MAYGDSMSYLPALSRLMGEVESPTQAQGLQQPQFGGNPEQLMAMLQSPHMQEQMGHWGVHFDPSQMRQSPFFPNQFMQQHPHLGGMLNAGMANMAATPEAPMVSGWGSGLSRATQGMMGGPELLRQYQIRQMMAPMQMIGAQMPMQEFQRKQQLLELLTKMEQDRQQLAQSHQQWQQNQPTKTPYGLIMPGQQTPVPQEYQGQTPQSMEMGSSPLMGPMFQGQGQQPFQSQAEPTFKPYDPNMLRQQTEATHPERGAGAELSKEKGKTEGAKRTELGARAEKERKQGEAAGKSSRAGDNAKWSGQYNKAEESFKQAKSRLDAALASKQIDQNTYNQMLGSITSARETQKSNVDKARGDPGASQRGLIGSGANTQQEQDYSATHEKRDGPQGYGWYLKGPATPPPPAP